MRYAFDGFVVTGLEASIQFTHSGSWFHVIEAAGADTDVAVHGARVVKASGGSGTGTVAMLGGDVGARITASGLTMGAGVDEYRPSTDGTMLYARTAVDGLPPVVNALPTASSTYRNRIFTVLGGAGVADVTSQCRKNAADAGGMTQMGSASGGIRATFDR